MEEGRADSFDCKSVAAGRGAGRADVPWPYCLVPSRDMGPQTLGGDSRGGAEWLRGGGLGPWAPRLRDDQAAAQEAAETVPQEGRGAALGRGPGQESTICICCWEISNGIDLGQYRVKAEVASRGRVKVYVSSSGKVSDDRSRRRAGRHLR